MKKVAYIATKYIFIKKIKNGLIMFSYIKNENYTEDTIYIHSNEIFDFEANLFRLNIFKRGALRLPF